MAKSKEVALKKEAPPARFEARAGDAEIGGKITAADMALPFLTILQGLSGPLKKDSPNYIKGAAIGDIYLSVLNKHWDGDEGVEIILCHYSRAYCERDPDIVTGPPINTYSPDDAIVLNTPRGDKGKMILPNGNELQETAFHAVLVNDNGKWVRAVMPMRSTSLKVSKRLNHEVMAFADEVTGEQQARWSRRWKLTSGTGTGGGNSWAVPVMTLLHTKEGERLWVDQETYDLARDWAITAGRLTNLANTEAAQAAKTGDNAQF
jgi:hypothetical protein